MAQERGLVGFAVQGGVAAPGDLEGRLIGATARERKNRAGRRARLAQGLFAHEREMWERPGLKGKGMAVPAVHRPQLLEELAQLERESAGETHPFQEGLLQLESRLLTVALAVALFPLERDQLTARGVPGQEDLGPGVGIESRLKRELQLPGNEVVVVGILGVGEREEVRVDADLRVEGLERSLPAHELFLAFRFPFRDAGGSRLSGGADRLQLVLLLLLFPFALQALKGVAEAVYPSLQRVDPRTSRVLRSGLLPQGHCRAQEEHSREEPRTQRESPDPSVGTTSHSSPPCLNRRKEWPWWPPRSADAPSGHPDSGRWSAGGGEGREAGLTDVPGGSGHRRQRDSGEVPGPHGNRGNALGPVDLSADRVVVHPGALGRVVLGLEGHTHVDIALQEAGHEARARRQERK